MRFEVVHNTTKLGPFLNGVGHPRALTMLGIHKLMFQRVLVGIKRIGDGAAVDHSIN